MREPDDSMTAPTTTTPISEKIGLRPDEAAELLGLGRQAIDELLKRSTDPIPSFRYGTRVVIPRRELVEWVGTQAKGTR
jgi:excisionase family DNA binding protein